MNKVYYYYYIIDINSHTCSANFLWLTVICFKLSDLFRQHGADFLNDGLQEAQVSVTDEPHAFHLQEDLQRGLKISAKSTYEVYYRPHKLDNTVILSCMFILKIIYMQHLHRHSQHCAPVFAVGDPCVTRTLSLGGHSESDPQTDCTEASWNRHQNR